ncbi:type II toxin-antitoxin system HicB family antitoxin [Halorientalis sp.]|jgi:predicted RNase H-like HicB family nuclease|uniref:type II toxin-antitoxin system HicB family antitoxin n=1 Tax=Halorientalis sp. TaxID=1931229 RepID=UPI00262F5641|nr:type II toxin-antitoxin system HicB family antitoxin [Halorientalis sp.]
MSCQEIRLIKKADDQWSAVDVETSVVTQGETRRQALEALDEAVVLYTDDDGTAIGDEVAYLEDHGINPAEVTDPRELPEVMQ